MPSRQTTQRCCLGGRRCPCPSTLYLQHAHRPKSNNVGLCPSIKLQMLRNRWSVTFFQMISIVSVIALCSREQPAGQCKSARHANAEALHLSPPCSRSVYAVALPVRVEQASGLIPTRTPPLRDSNRATQYHLATHFISKSAKTFGWVDTCTCTHQILFPGNFQTKSIAGKLVFTGT